MKTRTTFILSLTAILTLAAGSAFGKYSGGTGDPCTPYQIATKADLLALAANTADYNKCFILTADINMGGQVFTTAIIASDTGFTGTFDGNGRKITGFTINGGSNSDLGLFDYISGGSVNNLGLENFAVSGGSTSYVGGLVGENNGSIDNCYSTGSVSGGSDSSVGGLVGVNDNSISNCYSTGTVSVSGNSNSSVGGLVGDNGGDISNCYSTVKVSVGSNADVGGLVGFNLGGGTISNCHSTGQVSVVSDSSVGGLVGHNDDGSIISYCYSTSTINGGNHGAIGGLVGHNNSNISNCYSTGSVSGSDTVGGLVGHNDDGSSISNCYSAGAVSGSGYVGGLVGDNYSSGSVLGSFWDKQTSGQTTSAGGTGETTTQMKTLSTFTSAGWDFTNGDGNPAVWFMPIGWYPILSWQTGVPTSTVNVPDVVGMTADDANTVIVDANLVVGTVTTAYSDSIAEGNVISQNPTAGTTVVPNTAVDIVISLGASTSTVNVPDVFGMTQTNAQSAITSANLVVGTVTTAYSNTVAAGSVISQNPAAGTAVAVGSSVNYVESLGKPTVPNIVGMVASDANTAIVDVYLVVGTVTTKYSNTVDAGVVISQSPAAGKAVAIGSKVKYVRSLGKKPIVPNVVGMTAADANTAIVDANLVVGTVTTKYSNTVDAGKVISQGPAAGKAVAIGSKVKYVRSLGKKPIVPNIVGMTASDANTAIVDANLVVGTVTTKYSNTVDAGKVISQSPAAGKAVAIGSKVKYVRSLGKKPIVPNIVGMAASDANTAIVDANLVVGTVTTKYSNTVAAGNVISQSPAAGKAVAIGSKVKYVISLGKQ